MKRSLCFSLLLGAAVALVWFLKPTFEQGPARADAAGGQGAGVDGNGDVNGDLSRDLSDAIYLQANLFQGGPAPEPCPSAGGGAGGAVGGGGGPSSNPLPPTGQMLCYDDTGAETVCATGACFGQDGFYQAGCSEDPRFVDNGDFTVTDKCTGLMWQQNTADTQTRGPDESLVPDGLITHSECLTGGIDGDPFCCGKQGWSDIDVYGDDIPWCQALDYCEELTLATHNDWRLPNIQELQSIVDYSLLDPAVDTTFFGVLLPPAPPPGGCELFYWSSTRVEDGDEFDPAPGTQLAYDVNFFNGVASPRGRSNLHYVRAVRSVSPAGGGAGADGDGARRGGGAGPMCVADTDNGNVNGDGARDLSDAVYELAWLFQGGPEPEPFCIAAGAKVVGCAADNGNTNGDAARDLSDVIYLLAWLFQGGLAPVGKCGGSPPPEICDGLGGDEDGDGATDCDDDDCDGAVGCPGPEICTGGFDEDGDDDIDCDDSDCIVAQPEDPSLLPDTGVTLCWSLDNEEAFDCAVAACEEAPCPGQDGFYKTGCASDETRFSEPNPPDGTVTDNCTGLMWQKDTANTDGLGGVDNDDKLSWCAALSYCEVTLDGFATHTDWRLPNIREIQSIVDHSGLSSVGVFPPFSQAPSVGLDPVRYWSSTSRAGAPTCAWYTGALIVSCTSREKLNFVRAVRNAP